MGVSRKFISVGLGLGFLAVLAASGPTGRITWIRRFKPSSKVRCMNVTRMNTARGIITEITQKTPGKSTAPAHLERREDGRKAARRMAWPSFM